MLMKDKEEPFGPLLPDWYNDELLELAHELGIRLLTAFEQATKGIPYPRVCKIANGYLYNYFLLPWGIR